MVHGTMQQSLEVHGTTSNKTRQTEEVYGLQSNNYFRDVKKHVSIREQSVKGWCQCLGVYGIWWTIGIWRFVSVKKGCIFVDLCSRYFQKEGEVFFT